MSDMRIIEAAHEFVTVSNDVANSAAQRLHEEERRIRDLTNSEVFWTRAGAIIAGVGGVLGGAASIAAPLVPNGSKLGPMTDETIRTVLKTFGKMGPKVAEAGQMLTQGQSTKAQSERSLAERCRVAELQQNEGNSNSKAQQAVNAAQAVLSAKSRSE